ncbi:RNA polymerase sigma factor [Planctomycetota bacterium]
MLVMDTDYAPIIKRARGGDRKSWTVLFKRYQRRLYIFIHKACGNEADALDLLQDCFVTAIRKIHTLRSIGSFESWLFGIAYHLCLDYAKRKAKHPTPLDELEPTAAHDAHSAPPQEIYVAAEQVRQLLDALGRLPVTQRMAMELYHIEEKSTKEIAGIMNCSEKTVWSRLYLGRDAIKDFLRNI